MRPTTSADGCRRQEWESVLPPSTSYVQPIWLNAAEEEGDGMASWQMTSWEMALGVALGVVCARKKGGASGSMSRQLPQGQHRQLVNTVSSQHGLFRLRLRLLHSTADRVP